MVAGVTRTLHLRYREGGGALEQWTEEHRRRARLLSPVYPPLPFLPFAAFCVICRRGFYFCVCIFCICVCTLFVWWDKDSEKEAWGWVSQPDKTLLQCLEQGRACCSPCWCMAQRTMHWGKVCPIILCSGRLHLDKHVVKLHGEYSTIVGNGCCIYTTMHISNRKLPCFYLIHLDWAECHELPRLWNWTAHSIY